MHKLKHNTKITYKSSIVASIIILLIIYALIGGATTAFFTNAQTIPVNEFEAGTVIINKPTVKSSEYSFFNVDNKTGCRSITWELTSTGTKGTYLRVKPEALAELKKSGSEGTAFVGTDGKDINILEQFSTPFAQYFKHTLEDEEVFSIVEGIKRKEVGTFNLNSRDFIPMPVHSHQATGKAQTVSW
jgi:predicted ribosomally synthesized peptide with SipW-like signal peptide